MKDFNDLEKLVMLSFDEVKIQSNLIFDKHSGKIIGFVDFGDDDINAGTLTGVGNVATHVMSFHLRTFLGHVKFHLGFFATEGALSFQIYPLFWKAVGLLEMSCNLKVIGAVCDGASPNRKCSLRCTEKWTVLQHKTLHIGRLTCTTNQDSYGFSRITLI